MSPKAPSTRSGSASSTAGAPYSRRAPGQPKSSRQQFSACGACRMRRVRCDLKDLASSTSETHLSCSNCKERGLKCVDEFAEVKAVKLLRRGRRLQQVEAVYGKVADDASAAAIASTSSLHAIQSTPQPQSIIPSLKPEFLGSPFFRKFSLQHPILDPTEFSNRFYAFSKGNTAALTPEGQLCALLLVVWAASFGVDEYGVERADSGRRRKDRKERTDAMVQEVLSLIDVHGILRRPTWDGVRALLLVLPLTEDVQPHMDRLTMYEATLSQIYTLCSVASPSSVHSGQGPYGDALVRARIFWYAYIHEGITTGLRGGRLILSEDDLTAFQNTLPPPSRSHSHSSSPASSLPSPSSPSTSSFPTLPALDHLYQGDQSRTSISYILTFQLFSVSLHLASVCRKVHAVLTGPKARHFHEVDEEAMLDIWTGLARSWEEFETIKRTGAGGIGVGGAGALSAEDVERFVSSWQIFIFECHNIIREALKQRIVSQDHAAGGSPRYTPSTRLHAHASRKCRTLLPYVVDIVRRHLATPSSGLFAFDASIVRDGCFFAGFLLARGNMGAEEADEVVDRDDIDVEEGVHVCLRALGEMRWTFSKSEEREQTVRAVWEARLSREAERRHGGHRTSQRKPTRERQFEPQEGSYPQGSSYLHKQVDGLQTISIPPAPDRPHLPPLTLSLSTRDTLGDSGPTTACTDGSWPTYTPPTTSSSTHLSSPSQHGSPPSFHYLAPNQFKVEAGGFYPDMDPFNFSAPGPLSVSAGSDMTSLAGPAYHPSHQSHDQVGPGANGDYLDPSVIFSSPQGSGIGSSEEDCPHFGSECNGLYH